MQRVNEDGLAGIDVVVPAYNAGAYIEACIGGLIASGFAPQEIIVVDDGSTDDTRARCLALGIEPVSLRRKRRAAGARNAGASAGRADVLFFVDADVVVAPDARSVLERFFRTHPDHAAVFGTYDDAPAAPGRVSRIRNLLHRHVHLLNAGPAITFWSGCGAVRRTAFERVGGFDESITMMEDVDLGLRLVLDGSRIWLLPDLQGTHLKEWTLLGIARTDLFDRAIPWARRLARSDVAHLPDALNVSATGRVSVLAVAASLVPLLLLPAAPLTAGLAILSALLVLVLANRDFLGILIARGGLTDGLAAIGVLWVHYFCGGLGFAWVRSTRRVL